MYYITYTLRVPGHSDIQGYKSANELAKGGAGQAFYWLKPCNEITYKLVKLILRNHSTHAYYDFWLQTMVEENIGAVSHLQNARAPALGRNGRMLNRPLKGHYA